MIVQGHSSGINGIVPLHNNFSTVNLRWNTNQEVASILYAAPHHPEWISQRVIDLPRCGSQQLFSRYDGNWFKCDSFEWKRRREGKVIREDHMKLKVNKQEVISANYAHSAIVPTFHRRVYWLTNNPTYVLVHYLNTPEEGSDVNRVIDGIASAIRGNGITISYDNLLAQLHAIYSSAIGRNDVISLCDSICQRLENDNGEHQTRPSTSQLERRNSCSSAFRRGLSSMALRRQPSTYSDSVDAHYVGVVVSNCVAEDPSSHHGRLSSSGAYQDRPDQNQRLSYGNDMTGSAMDTAYSHPDRAGGGGAYSSNQLLDQRSHSGETQRSREEEDMSLVHPLSSVSASSAFESAANVPPIDEIAPNRGNMKGGFRVLIIGDWFMKGHVYSVLFGERRVAAALLRPGLLAVTSPPGSSSGPVTVRVFCNDVLSSQPGTFHYEDVEDAWIRQALISRIHLIVMAFAALDSVKDLPSPSDEQSVLTILRAISSLRPAHPMFLATVPSLPCRTILHLAAQLDYATVIQHILTWRRSLPFSRELDPLARDSDGSTPLHLAATASSANAAKMLVELCPMSVDVLDDRGKTACDLAPDGIMTSLTSRLEQDNNRMDSVDKEIDDLAGHASSTALWVMTDGERVTDRGECRDDERRRYCQQTTISPDGERTNDNNMAESSGQCVPPLHVEISMDTDVQVPDSPKMADLFHAVTSPGVLVNDNTRQKMASLAKQIIDALPARIKNDSSSLALDDSSFCVSGSNSSGLFFPDVEGLSHMIGSNGTETSSHAHEDFCWTAHAINAFGMATDDSTVSPSPSHSLPLSHTLSQSAHLLPPSSSHSTRMDTSQSTSRNTFESNSFDFDKDLGEFFSIHVDGDVDPIQQRLGDLKLTDVEQREVYEAAMVIQRAYREYRERNTNRRQQAEVERSAAVTIQSCYRRYKQFCYFKKLHSAAIVVQKHFRLKKVNQKECPSSNGDDVQVREHPTLDGQILRIQVPQNSSFPLREHRAATTIQLAYRGHRKRQIAARTIQRFMKESRQKLRRLAEQSGDAVSCQQQQQAPPLFPMAQAGAPPPMTSLNSNIPQQSTLTGNDGK